MQYYSHFRARGPQTLPPGTAMTAITNFVRKTSGATLRAYFKQTGIQLMAAIAMAD